jgi:hypothetical protein
MCVCACERGRSIVRVSLCKVYYVQLDTFLLRSTRYVAALNKQAVVLVLVTMEK